MAEINGVGGVNGPQRVTSKSKAGKSEGASAASESKSDTVEISNKARVKGLLEQVPEVRQEKIDAIKAEIEQGTYMTDEKVNEALDKLLDEML